MQCSVFSTSFKIPCIYRRELCGLPNEDFCEVPLRPNTDMELWNKAVQLLRGSDTNSSAVLSESNTCIKTTPVHG